MLKARIKNLEAYLKYIKENTKEFIKSFNDSFHGMWNTEEVKRLNKAHDVLFFHWFGSDYSVDEKTIEKIIYINQYITQNHFYWEVPVHKKGFAALHYGSVEFLIPEDNLEYKEEKDYSSITMSALSAGITDSVSMLPAELSDTSLSDIQHDYSSVSDSISKLKQEERDIKEAKTGELKDMQDQINTLMEKMNQKKQIMMQELERKMELFRQQKQKLEAQIYMLQTEIYSIRCYLGETVELIGIREGKSAPLEEPIILNQKILYLDEDLARMMSIYGFHLENYKLLEEAIKYNDDVFNAFCPQEKCITFFRVSRHAERTFYNSEISCMDSYDMLHGKKIGFAVRNGENLYLGWLEEKWEEDRELTFEENVMLRAGKKEIADGNKAESTPIKERVSRMFALNVLRGLLDNKHLLNIPDGEDLLRPSKYIIYNYADAWLEDNRYGDFATLVKNLHEYNREKDTILLITAVSEVFDSYKNGPERGLEDAQVNRTHDCSVSSGLNTINMIDEHGNIFVSAEKEYSICGARSNFLIKKHEFLNLTFMNSLWLEYYIMTKKIGDFGRKRNRYGNETSLDYAYLIPYFKKALEYIREREQQEAELIEQYVQLKNFPEWQILLSHWKIAKKVHKLTDYQAKRFAKYLEAGIYFEMAHLFDKKYQSNKPDLHGSYSTTNIYAFGDHHYVRWAESTGKNHPLYGYGTKYENVRFNNDTEETIIQERVSLDKKKLECIKQEVDQWLEKQNVTVEEILAAYSKKVDAMKNEDEKARGHWGDPYRIYRKNTVIGMFVCEYLKKYEVQTAENLPEKEKEYFLLHMRKSGSSIDEKLYPLCYYRLLQYECFDTIIDIADETLRKRWSFATRKIETL